MNSEYLPSFSEKLANGIALIGVALLLAALVVLMSSPPTFNGISGNTAEAARLAGIGSVLMVTFCIAALTLSKERRAGIQYEAEAMRIAAADPTNLSDDGTKGAIAVLHWTIDLEAHTRAYFSMMRGIYSNPRSILLYIFLAACMAGYTGITPTSENTWPPPISLSETKP
jgi:hypothetical protein